MGIRLFFLRLDRAWAYYTRLNYTWRLSWHKAAVVLDEHADLENAGTL